MTEEQFAKELGARIRFLRRGADLTQATVSRKLGYASNSHLCQIERGQKLPSVYQLFRIEQIVGPVWIDGADSSQRRKTP